MAVTIPSSTGTVTIAPGTGDVLQLASQIGQYLSQFSGSGLQIQAVTTSGALPTPPGGSSPKVLEIDSNAPVTCSVPDGWQYVVDFGTGPDNLSVSNTVLLTGTAGGSWNVSGNSTVAATGGNNTVSATGNYTLSFGPGNNVVFASGTGTTADDPTGSAIIVSGALDGSGSNTITSAGSSDLVVALGQTSVNSTGANFGLLGDGGPMTASLSGSNATVAANNSNTTVTSAGGNALIFGGVGGTAGTLNVTSTGNNDTVSTFDSQATIDSSGSDAVVFGGTANTSVNVTGTGDTLVGGSGPGVMTVDASSAAAVFGGAGEIDFIGGAATSTLVGGTGGSEAVTVGSGGIIFSAGTSNNSTIVGGTAPGIATIFGGSGSIVNFNETIAGTGPGAIFDAADGNETLSAALSNTNNTLTGGTVVGSTASLVGGSGDNTFFSGPSADTMTGGPNSNTFAFFSSSIQQNAQFTITNFTSSDQLDLVGFDSTQSLANVLGTASTGPSGLTITLSDNVTITFSNLTDTSTLANKTFYG